MTWTIQYYSGSAWVTKADAVIDQVTDELNGQLELDFIIPNTLSNLSFVQSDQQVQILWGSTSVFSGLLRAYKATFTQIECTVYNNTFELMKKRQITGKYNNVAANTVLASICSVAGMTAGSCPSTAVSTQFNATDCYTAALNLANILGLDLYNVGTTVDIAVKGNQTPAAIVIDSQSSVNIDRSKAGYDGVIIRGVDQTGSPIAGSAGNTGASYNVKTLTNKVAMSQASLNSLASAYLQSLQQTNSGSPLECDIGQAATLSSGDLITVTNGADFGLSGSYEIYRITKNLTKVTVEIVRPVNIFDSLISAMADSTSALNTLPMSSDQVQTPTALVLQGLLDLYHLTEGQGTLANDSAPNSTPNNGTISGGTWVQGPLSLVLQFAGSGYVDCTANVSLAGTNKLAIGGWFSPYAYGSDQNYVIAKDGQFLLQQVGTSGAVQFGVHIGGGWVYLTSPAGIAPLNGRCFAMGVYDGSNMYLYVADPSGVNQLLTFSQAQTGNLDASTSDVFLASKTSSAGGFNGVVAECMIWGRALSAQEVQELFFRPLTRIINLAQKGLYLIFGTSIKESFTVVPTYLLDSCILSGKVVVSSPTGTMNSYEAGYVVLALLQFGGSSYYSLVQSILDLWASLQNSDGSWYQQYNPYSPYACVAQTSEGTDGNLKVDSGAALLAWAMSNYDRLTSGARYKANVQKTLDFLRILQYAHTMAYSSNLIANEILDGVTDTTALLADCAECLLSAKFAMDAYAASLTTTSGYGVQTFANNLYYSIAVTGWRGNTFQYYDTSYPYGQNTNVPFTYQEKISYTQALCSWAVYVFAKSAYLTASDFSSQCEICLDYINTLTRGSWGGEYYCPYTGASDETQDEFSGYSALMSIACNKVNSTKYSSLIAGLTAFLKWLALNDGQVCDCVDVTGKLWRSKIAPLSQTPAEGGFLVLPIALALLAGAGT
jgi:hypothetical protein